MSETIQQMPHEDEIDLRELLRTIIRYKKFIVVITVCVTLFAVVYSFLKTPIYEVKVLLEIGDYKSDNNNNNNRILLDNVTQLEKKMRTLYIDMVKEEKNKEVEINSITVPKGLINFLEIKAEAISNKSAVEGIEKIVLHIQKEHQKTLDDVKQRREFELKNITLQIKDIQDKTVILLDKKIELQKKNLEDLRKQLNDINENLRNLQSLNPSLAALKLMEKRDISNAIINVTTQLFDMESQRNELLTTTIYKLEESKKILETLLLPHNYKNTLIVGQIMQHDKPVKPKKTLIVVVACVTGFILSIFMVFLFEMVRSPKNEE